MYIYEPPIVKYLLWKALLASALLGVFIGILAIIMMYPYCLCFRIDLLVLNIIVFTAFGMYQRWVWRFQGKSQQWLRWLGLAISTFYLALLILLGSITAWNKILPGQWKYLADSILVAFFLASWLLAVFKPNLAKRFADLQDEIGLKILFVFLPAVVILGALYGMYWAQENQLGEM